MCNGKGHGEGTGDGAWGRGMGNGGNGGCVMWNGEWYGELVMGMVNGEL